MEVSGGARLSRWVGGVAALVSQCCSRVLCLGLALLLGAGLAVAADTVGPLSPSSNSGGWTDASNAYADGGGYAYTTANDYHSYYGFDFSGPNDIPDGALIDSITIYIDISAVPTCIGCVNLTYSLDGGTNWIPANWLSAGSSESTESVTYTVNDYVATDVESQLQLRIGHNDPGRTLYLDWIRVEVNYTPDTTPPSVSNVSVSDTLISDADAGNTFTVTVDFSEDMTTDGSADPTLIFSPTVGSTLSSTGGSWPDGDTYQATYTIADAGVDEDSVTIDVTGGKDEAGNDQQDYTPLHEFEIDTLNPGKPAVAPDLESGSDNGESDSDDVTNDDTPTFSGPTGSVEGSSTVELFRGGTTFLGTASAAGNGSWSLTSAAIPDGSHDITVTATDAAGNQSSPSDALPILIDTQAPPAPGDTGRIPANGAVTNDNTPQFEWDAPADPGGSGVRDYRVKVYDSGPTLVKDPYVSDTDYTPATSLGADGVYTWVMYTRDVAGNTGSEGASWSLTVDTTGPRVAITRDDPDPTNATSVVFSVDFSEDVVSVDSADFNLALSGVTANATVTVGNAGDSDDSTYTVTVDTIGGDGTLGLDFDSATDIEDLAGNALNQTPTADETYTIDNTDPDIASITTTTADGLYGIGAAINITITFTESVSLITGPLYVNLDTGAQIDFAPFTNVTVASATYTVQAGESTTDLDGVSVGVTGYLRDAAGNEDDSISVPSPTLADLHDVEIKATQPTVTGLNASELCDDQIYVYFDGAMLDADASPTNYTLTGTGAGTLASNPDSVIYEALNDRYLLTWNSGEMRSDEWLTITVANVHDMAGNIIDPAANSAQDLGCGTEPQIASFDSTTPDGRYGLGAAINITVTFTEPTRLEDGDFHYWLDTGAQVDVSPFAETLSISTTYIVGPGENSSDLWVNSVSIDGYFRDAAGNENNSIFVPNDLSAGHDIVIDTAAPTVSILVSDQEISDVDVGLAAYTVTATFNEEMNPAIVPTLTLDPNPSTTLTHRTGVWSGGNTIYTWTFDVEDAGVDVRDIDVIVSGGEDLVGNAHASSTEVDEIDVDTANPTIASITPTQLAEADVGTVTVQITFSEAMETTTNPSPTIAGLVTDPYTITGSSWSNGDRTWTGTFAFNDDDEQATGGGWTMGTYNVSGFQDAAGNPIAADNSNQVGVDTVKPTVTSLTPTPDAMITDADVGDFSGDGIDVVFSETMIDDASANPTFTFVPNVDSTLPLAETIEAVWMDGVSPSNSFRWLTHAADANIEVDDVTVDVEDVKDAAGNPLDAYTPQIEFDIDTKNPQATVTTDHTTVVDVLGDPTDNAIYENSTLLTVTVVYDEDMDTGTTPTITLENEVAARWTGPTGGSWGGTTDTYTATFTHDGVEEEIVGSVFARVADESGATDLAGNADLGDDSDIFDIDTRQPRATVTTDHTTVLDLGGDPTDNAIYENSTLLTVTVVYDEPMDTGRTWPVITLEDVGTNNTWGAQTPQDVSGWQNATTFVATFTHNGDEEPSLPATEITAFARVANASGAKDLAGNEDVGDDSDIFDIDTRQPRATVTTNRTTVVDTLGDPTDNAIYENSLVLTVTVVYDEPMDTGRTWPVITLEGVSTGNTWGAQTPQDTTGWTDEYTFVATFTHDGTEEPDLPSTEITAFARVEHASGAKDLAGNEDVGDDSDDFEIDTRKPRATVTTDHTTVVDTSGDPTDNAIYENSTLLTVTVVYDEPMDTGRTWPLITLEDVGTNNTWGAQTPQDVSGWQNATTFVATFTHNGDEEPSLPATEITAFARVANASGAKDLAGNADVGDDSPVFEIDTREPRATVTTNHTTVVDGGGDPTDNAIYEGSLILTVTVDYDEPMDTGRTWPVVTLEDVGTGGTWGAQTPQDVSGWIDEDTFVATFTHDGTEEPSLPELAITAFARVSDASGAKDLAGNVDVGDDSPVFEIDTRKPRGTVTVDHTTVLLAFPDPNQDPIYENSLVLEVTVVYDEPMDTSRTWPVITLEDVGTGNTWGAQTPQGVSGWTDEYTFVATFTHDGTEEPALPDIVIPAYARVSNSSGAKDLAGNEDIGDDSPIYDIDTRKPRSTVTTDHTTIGDAYGDPAKDPIYENSLVLAVTVEYDEPMDTRTAPTITLEGETVARWTGPTGGTWGTTDNTYVATFTHDGIDDEVAGVYAQVLDGSGATDEAGNAEVGDVSPTFDVDTRKPTILLIEVEENSYCDYGCYGAVPTLPLEQREFDTTIEFSESVWQPVGADLVLTFNLDEADDPLIANDNTLTYAGIGPNETWATAVWDASQFETRTNVVEMGDNTCDLAVTTIESPGPLYDVAGNLFVVPNHPLGRDHNVYENQDIIVDTVAPTAVDDPEVGFNYRYVQPQFLAFSEFIEGKQRIVLREDTEIYIDVLANDPDNCEASKHLLSTSTWPELPEYGTVSIFDGYPTPFPASGCNARIVRYIPPHNYTGPDFFTYRMRDCSDNQATARVDLYVFSRNIVANTYYTTYQGLSVPFALETQDDLLVRIADHTTFEYAFELVGGPEHGVLIGNVNDVLYDHGVGLAYVNMIYVPAGTPGTRELIEWAVTDPFTVRQSAFVDIEIVSREGTTTDVAPVVEIPIGAPVHIVPPQGFFDEVGVLGLRIEELGVLGEVIAVTEGETILDIITVLGDPSGIQYLQINTEVLAYGTYRLLVPFGGGEIVVPFLVKEGVE